MCGAVRELLLARRTSHIFRACCPAQHPCRNILCIARAFETAPSSSHLERIFQSYLLLHFEIRSFRVRFAFWPNAHAFENTIENIAEIAHITELRRVEAHAFPIHVAATEATPLAARAWVKTAARAAKAGRAAGSAKAIVLRTFALIRST